MSNSISDEPSIYNFGDSRTATVTTQDQDYNTIKQQCLASGTIFADPIFTPAVAGAKSKAENSQWLRPNQLLTAPKFIADGVSRFDAVQGGVGDCWLVSSVSILASNKRLFARVVPPDQTFDTQNGYFGGFRFRFWQYGKWVEITIDDYLATTDGELMFMRSSDPNEFWTPLLEKAYAKLHGSYQALVGGTTSEALVDFTGGITEYIDMHGEEKDKDIFSLMKKSFERGSLMGASIEASDADREAELDNGLIKGHAYSISDVTEFSIGGSSIKMIRLRNPWSGTKEWTGRWSDQSPEWTMISDYEKQKIGLNFQADGEFWMSFDDFKENFTRVEIVHLSPDSLEDNNKRVKWYTHMFEGKWINGISAGGCRNNLDTFATNPQYVITLSDYDSSGECEIIVSLMQKHRRSKYLMGSDQLTIGFAIYAIPESGMSKTPIGISTPRYHTQVLGTDFFKYNTSVARSPNYINLREVTNRFTLKPGKYCIIPSTYEPNEGDAEFILRVWTEAPMSAAEMDVKPGLYPAYPSGNSLLVPDSNSINQRPGSSANSIGGGGGGGGSGDNSGSPSYPPYVPAADPAAGQPSQPQLPSSDQTPTYPPLPDEPIISPAVAPKPQPGPNNYSDLGIDTEQVIGIITNIAGMLSNCINNGITKQTTSNTNEQFGRRNVSGLFSAPPPLPTQPQPTSVTVPNSSENVNGVSSAENENNTSAKPSANNTQAANATLASDKNVPISKVDAQLFFNKISGNDGYVDASELQSILNAVSKREFNYTGFTLDTCRALIAAADSDCIGRLGREQFEFLWIDILNWTRAFTKFDKDSSFTIDASELSAALNDTGIVASRKLLVAIIHRFGTTEKIKIQSRQSNGVQNTKVRHTLTLDAFVHSCVKLASALKFYLETQIRQKVNSNRSSFKELNRRAFRPDSPLSISSQHLAEPYEDTDTVRIGLDEFLQRVMYS